MFIIYILLFIVLFVILVVVVVGWSLIRNVYNIFFNKGAYNNRDRSQKNNSDNYDQSQKNRKDKIFGPNEGEYIDFEEIKDDEKEKE